MGTLKAAIACSALAVVISGCNSRSFSGSMNVYHPFSIEKRHIGSRTVKFKPGRNYRAKLEFKCKNKVELEVEGYKKVKIKVPEIDYQADGMTRVSASQINQEFDAELKFSTNVDNSPSVYGTLSCVLGTNWEVIYYDSNGPVSGHVTQYGSQTAMYHTKTITRTLDLTLVAPRTHTALADINGSHTSSSTVIDQILSPCS